jgi:glycosyltransferase involved in cell wall biosynthesis
MEKVFILYENFYTPNGNAISIGGIQTYITMLIKVIEEMKLTPVILQFADRNFVNNFNGTQIYGVAMENRWSKQKKNKILFNKYKELRNKDKDIVIFACDTMIVKNSESRSMGIQHGIRWDVRGHENYNHTQNLLFVFWRAAGAFNLVIRAAHVKKLIAVDYNFLNWYRSQVAYIENKVFVIPNCTPIPPKNSKPQGKVNIIFARRFQTYRGTKLFSNVITEILKAYNNVQVTFAGSGPDEKYLKDKFVGFDNVNFIKYESAESLKIHADKHIAVIPTIGSEGTSLSLLEAMAAQCAVIATNVGGMTNIVLDEYNGLLINPEEEELYDALEKLITDQKLREKISENAYISVKEAFNNEIWIQKWKSILKNID